MKHKAAKTPILFLDIDHVLNSDGAPASPPDKEWDHAVKSGFPDSFLEKLLDPTRMTLLRSIMERVPDAKIVIHSSWRKRIEQTRLISLLARLSGLDEERFLGCAPFKFSSERTYEIMMWVRDNDTVGSGTYAILDNEDLSFPGQGEDSEENHRRTPEEKKRNKYWRKVGLQRAFFTTDPIVGLTQEIADAVVARLRGEDPR